MNLRKIGLSAVLITGLLIPLCAQDKQALDVLPTMSSRSDAANQIWVGAFQLLWNDFMKELGGPAQPLGEFPPIVYDLNKKGFTKQDLSEESYYAKQGRNTPALKREMEKDILEKFNEESQVLDKMQWDSSGTLFYVMLKKDFEFMTAFNDVEEDSFGPQGSQIEYFGAVTKEQKESVKPLFYSPGEFAVRLRSKQNDEIYLYRTNATGTLEELYQRMLAKMSTGREAPLGAADTFKAPKLNIETEREFSELQGLRLQNGGMISKALEHIQFKMDREGVRLVAEAIMGTSRGIVRSRHFDFDGRYVIFIQEAEKKPYFALLVDDALAL